jgi:adenosylhomocysteine nucleosidase
MKSGFTLGILVALPQEARAILRHCSAYMGAPAGESGVILDVCGVGAAQADAGANRLAAAGVSALLSWGTAAGLQPGVAPGTLLLPETIIAAAGGVLAIDKTWHQRIRQSLSGRSDVIVGPLAESAVLLRTQADKQNLYDATGAAAADMESAAAARVARRAGIPFAVIRAVADPAAGNLPDSVTAAVGPGGQVNLGRLLGSLLIHPHEWSQIMRLARWFGAAQTTLMQAAKQAGPFLLSKE